MSSPMKAAFLVLRVLPPPPPRPLVLARGDGTGAGGAADGAVALLVEPVGRQFVTLSILPHLCLGPVEERIYLENAAVGRVCFDGREVRSGDALFSPHPGYPAAQSL